MRRVLVVAYYFPPIGGIGSIRLARFAEHLPDFGWEPIVLAPRDTPHRVDPQLSFPEERVVRSRSIEISRLARAVPDGLRGRDEGAGRRSLRGSLRAAGRRAAFPDPQIGWYPGAVVAGARALRRVRVDAVYSSSHPVTAHLVGGTLSRLFRLPWIAEFRDPWSDALSADSPHRQRAERLEQAIAGASAALVMPTPTWAAHHGSRWGRKVVVIPNGYDDVIPCAAPPAQAVIAHLGTYYAGRQSLLPLWEAVARLRRECSAGPPRIRFIGELTAQGRAEVDAAGVGDLLEVTGSVGHDQAMHLLSDSSVLVASGDVAGGVLAQGWVPAKLFEYLATPLPILYLGEPTDDAARMLRGQPGCAVIRHTDSAQVDAALSMALSAATHDRAAGFTRRAGALALATLLDEVTR